ncbi:hypothetical protein RHGRI_030122 [Rhododendron griersonianum]|uniref:Uncharacterized protein n=1 Tax=Rhododendron griersonianum TaxID=479676 RepID=A0AAV6ILV0_9ERIC|nr:hypothetical protein RHGRI_030122 [Rhododendron griersonianum]
MGLLLRTDASDPHLDLGGSVVMTYDYQLTDTDARRSRQTSGLTTVLDHEQQRDEAKKSKALDDDDHHDHDKLPTTYHLSLPLSGPIVPCYAPTSFTVDYNILPPAAMGPPDAERDLGSFSDEDEDEDIYCKVYKFSNGFVEDNDEYVEKLYHEHLLDEAKQSKAQDDDDDDELPTTYQLLSDLRPGPTVPSYKPTSGYYDAFRATARFIVNNPPVSFTEEETRTYNKIVR